MDILFPSPHPHTLTQFSFTTLQSCLSYFSSHGLVELPLSGCGEEEYHLPQVQSLDNIVRTMYTAELAG